MWVGRVAGTGGGIGVLRDDLKRGGVKVGGEASEAQLDREHAERNAFQRNRVRRRTDAAFPRLHLHLLELIVQLAKIRHQVGKAWRQWMAATLPSQLAAVALHPLRLSEQPRAETVRGSGPAPGLCHGQHQS